MRSSKSAAPPTLPISARISHPVSLFVHVRVDVMRCVLQCVAVRCSALQCVAVCCGVLQCVAVCCSGWQRVAACCSVLQGVAVCCSVRAVGRVWQYQLCQHMNESCLTVNVSVGVLWSGINASICRTLQHTATHCNTLQHTATHCNTLQHASARCNSGMQGLFVRLGALNNTTLRCVAAQVCCSSSVLQLKCVAVCTDINPAIFLSGTKTMSGSLFVPALCARALAQVA